MNEQGMKAFEDWFVNNTAHSLGSGYAATSETAWLAACEYKDKQLAAKDAVIKQIVALLSRYRAETPLGNQPNMIAHEVDAVLATLYDDSALQEMLKQAKREALLSTAKDAVDHRIKNTLNTSDLAQNDRLAFMAKHCRRKAEEIK